MYHPLGRWIFEDELRRLRVGAFAIGVLVGTSASAIAFLLGSAG